MIDPSHLKRLITETLNAAGHGLCTPAAVQLLLGTAACESQCGQFLYQVGGGPALGVYQMEPRTERDIWMNYLEHHRDMRASVIRVTGIMSYGNTMAQTGNLVYQTLMARLHYWRVAEPLPTVDAFMAQAFYHKAYYNTPRGKSTPERYMDMLTLVREVL